MDMYKEFKKKIDSMTADEISEVWESVKEYENVGPLASEFIKELEQLDLHSVSNWVDVKDSPKFCGVYFVKYGVNNLPTTGSLGCDGKWRIAETITNEVTHWMKIPD